MQQCSQQQDRGTQEHVLRAAEGDARDNQQQYISSPQYPKDEQQPLQQGKYAQPRPQPRQGEDHWTRLGPVQQQEKQHFVERLQQQNPCKRRNTLVSSSESEKPDVWLDDTDTAENAEQWDAFCCFVEQQEDQTYPSSAATPRVATYPHSAATPATFVNDYAAAAPPSSAAAMRTFKVDPNATGTAAFASAAAFGECDVIIAEEILAGKLSASPARADTRSLMGRSCSGKREEVLIPAAAAVASMPAPRRYSAVSAQRYQQTHVIQKNMRHHLRQKQRQEQQPHQQQQQWQCRDQQQRPQLHQHRQRMLFASFKKYVVERNSRNKAGERQQQELQEDVLAPLRLPTIRRRLLLASKREKTERDLTSLQHQQQTAEEQHQHLQQHRMQLWSEQSGQRNLHAALEKQMQGYYQIQQPEEGEYQQQLKRQQQNGKIHAVTRSRKEQQQTPEEVTKTQQWRDGPDSGVQRHHVGGDTTQHREQQAPCVEGNMQHQQKEGKEEDKEEHECFEDDSEQQQQQGRQRLVQYQPEKHQQHKKNAEAKKQATGVRHCPQIKDVGGREHESTLRAGLEQRQPQQRQQQHALQQVLHLALVQQRQQDKTKTQQRQEKQHGIQQHLQRAWQKKLHQEEWNQQQQQKRQQQQQRYERQDKEHAHEEQRQKNSQEKDSQERKKEASLPTNWQPTMQEKPQQIQQEQEQGRQYRKRRQKAPFIIRPQAEEKHKQQEEEQHMGQQQLRQKNQGSRIFLLHGKGRRTDRLLQEEVYNNRIHATLDALAAAQRAWLRQERERLNTRRFTVLQLLGRGAAGSVYLVEDCTSTGRGRRGKRRRCSSTRSCKRYALKVIPKQSFQTAAARRRVLLEQQVFMDLQQLRQAMQRRKQLQGREERQSAKQQRSAPKKQQCLQGNAKQHHRSKKPLPPLATRNTCCVRLEGSFQDAENLYQLLEYLPGGDLRAKINAAVAAAPSKTAPAQEAAGRLICSFKEETGSTHSSMAMTSDQEVVVQGISSLHGAIGGTAYVARSAGESFATATEITATATTVTATEGAAAAGASTGDKKAAQRIPRKAAPAGTLPAFAAASANSEAVVVAAGAAEGGHLRVGAESEDEAPCAAAAAAAGSSARVVTEVHKHSSAAIAGKTRPLAASVGGDTAVTAADTGELHAAAGVEGLGCFRIACMRESERRRIFAQIVWGVRTLHALGYIHRDIKPENVGFDGAGNAKLLDFGLCCRPVHAREHGQQGKQPKQQQLLLLRQGRQQQQQGEKHKKLAPTGQTGQPQWLVQTQHTHQRRQRLHEERRTRQQQQMQANLQQQQQRWQLQLGRQQQHREAQVENRESKAPACAWQTQAIRGSNSETAVDEQAQQRIGRPAARDNSGDGKERRTARRRSAHADGLVRARSADGGRVTLLSRWEKDAVSSPPCAARPAALSFAPAAAAPADYAVTACPAASSACDVSDTFAVPAASSVAVWGPPSIATAAGGVRKSAAAAAFAVSDSASLSACGDAVTASIFRRGPASPAIASLSSSFSKGHARARSRRKATSVLFSCFSSALHPLSVAGTLQYMAPEVLLQQEYSFAADWWSVGVMLFECTYGCLPFCFPACDSELLLRACSSKLQNSSGVHAGGSAPLEPPYVEAGSSSYLSLSNVHAFGARVLLQPYLNGRGNNSEDSSLLSCAGNDLLAPNLEACSSTLTQLPDLHAEREGCGLRLPFQGDGRGSDLLPLSKMDARPNTAQARGPSHAHARPWFVPSSNVLLLSLFLRERYERGGFCPAFLFFADTGENAAGKKQHRHAQQQSTTVKNKPAVQGGIEVDADEENEQQRGKGEDNESDGEGEGEDRVGRVGGESAVTVANNDGKVRVGKGIVGGKHVQIARKRREQLHRVQLELRQQQQQQVREKKQHQQEHQMLLRERDKQRSPQKQQQQAEVKQHQEGKLDQQQLWLEMQHLHLNTQQLATPVDEEEYDFRVSNACIQVMQNLLCGSRKRWNFRQLCACAWLRDYFGSHGDGATTCNEQHQQHSEEMQHQQPMCGRSKLELQRQRRRKQQRQQRRQQQQMQCMHDCCWKPQQMQNLKGNWRLNLRQQHLHLQQQHAHTQQQQQLQHDVRAQQQQQAEQQQEVHTQPQQWQQRHRFRMQQSQQQLKESTPTLMLQQQPVVQQRRVRLYQSRTRCRSRQQQELHQQRSRGGLLDDVARADRRDSSSPRLPAEAAATILAAAEATAEAAGDAAPAEQVKTGSGEALAAEPPTAAASKAALEGATRGKRKPAESFLLLPAARFGRSPRVRQMCRSTCRRKVDYTVHDTGSSKSNEEEQDACSSCSHQTSLREGGNACSSRVCDNSNSKASREYEADGRRLCSSKCRNTIRGKSLNRQSSSRNSSREICCSGYTCWTRESSECRGSTSGSDGNAPSSSARSRIYSRETRTRDSNRETWYSGSSWCSCSSSSWHSSTRGGRDSGSRRRRSATRVMTASSYRSSSTCSSSSGRQSGTRNSSYSSRRSGSSEGRSVCCDWCGSSGSRSGRSDRGSSGSRSGNTHTDSSSTSQQSQRHHRVFEDARGALKDVDFLGYTFNREELQLLLRLTRIHRRLRHLLQQHPAVALRQEHRLS